MYVLLPVTLPINLIACAGIMDSTPSPGTGWGLLTNLMSIGQSLSTFLSGSLSPVVERQLAFDTARVDSEEENETVEEDEDGHGIRCKCINKCYTTVPGDIVKKRRADFIQLNPTGRQQRCYIELGAMASQPDMQTSLRTVSTRYLTIIFLRCCP